MSADVSFLKTTRHNDILTHQFEWATIGWEMLLWKYKLPHFLAKLLTFV